ncbi:MAG TPA: nucleotidyl transferase AbiEii/AbiGii toxin family protein, partial [Puia sp.]|nr:nucleotidyl transferase AbiEii/AbiGii toxin family protein [Puia sp.]
MLHEETVATGTLELIRKLSQDSMLQDFVLVGGTALALQLGHRKSVDIDLFASRDIEAGAIAKHLEKSYNAKIDNVTKNGVFGWIDGVKTSLIAHHHDMIAPLVTTGDVRMASLDDIGAMKMHAITNSGQRAKDFIDMYYLLE